MTDLSFNYLASLFEEAPIMLYVALIAGTNLILTLLEGVADFALKKKRRWKDTTANIVIHILNTLVERTIYGALGFIGLYFVYQFTSLQIPMTWWSWITAILAADFSYYWMHRAEHKCRLFWAHHSVHHSSEDYNLTVALRLSVVEGIFEWIFLIPMVLAGFNPFQTIIAIVLVAQYQHWIHNQYIGKLGSLEGLVNTPSAHRVHHGSNTVYLDRNFGGILMIWDRIFGTYCAEREQVRFGLTKNIKTNNPLRIIFCEYPRIWRDLKKRSSLSHKISTIFGPLDWKPVEQNKKPKNH